MRHFFSTRVRVVLVASVLIAVVLAVISGLTGMSLPDMFVKGVLSPIRTGASKLTDQAEQIYSYMFRYEALAAENEALKEQISQMQDDARVADSVSRENDRLRDLLELTSTNEDYKLVDAYIYSWSSVDYTSTITVSKGQNAGIETGMCAITANGEVVGLVIEAGSNYAVIKTVLDSSLEISATIAASGYNGMVSGGYFTGLDGMLRMDYLPTNAVIRNNDQVVTSGSTVYPRDLIMGYVVDAGFDDTGVAKFAVLKPAADIDTLEQVFILTEFNVG
ncbi:MAG: rod shape-determining protein MreC [Oscillospiraceae bacterium]|nr:rod shape-determining protein MreC [Oscillospiraceae bacterium]